MRSGTHNYRWLRCAKLEQQFYLRLISEAIGLRVRGDDIEKPGYRLRYLKIEQALGAADLYHPSSTILPRDLPDSSSACARFKLVALMLPKVWSSVVRNTPLSMRSATSFSK